jgi:hypothetical protein
VGGLESVVDFFACPEPLMTLNAATAFAAGDSIMPNVSDILASLPTITTFTAVVGMFVTASLIIVLHEWSHALLALAIQYLLFAWLLTTVIPLPLALIKALTGTIACVTLYWSARRTGELPTSPFESVELDEIAQRLQRIARRKAIRTATGFSMRMPFRIGTLSLAALATYGLATRYPLPRMTPAMGLACTWLAVASIVLLALTESPLRTGMGLLTWLMAFEMFYVTWERSLTIAGFLGMATLFVALGAGYLTSVRGGEEES